MPPVWKEIAVNEAKKSLASHHSGKRGCCLRHESIYGLKENSAALRMCLVPGCGTRGYPDELETCPA